MANGINQNQTDEIKDLFSRAPRKTEIVSDHIIEQIRDAVLSGRFKAGDRLASEKELVEGFGVSKASIREAVRVLEVMGLVQCRKGSAGGVYIAEVDMKTAVYSLMNFLNFTSISIKDITMLRYLLEPAAARMAAAHITDEGLAKLEELVQAESSDHLLGAASEIGFHRYLARFSENPILILIMDFVDSILDDLKVKLNLETEFYTKVQNMHQEILGCLARRDSEAAAQAITRDLLVVGDYMADVTGTERFDPAQIAPAHSEESGGADPTAPAANGLVLKHVETGELYMFCSDSELKK